MFLHNTEQHFNSLTIYLFQNYALQEKHNVSGRMSLLLKSSKSNIPFTEWCPITFMCITMLNLLLVLPWQFYYIFHIVWSSLITGYAHAPPDEAQHIVGLVSNPRGMHPHLRSSVTMGCRYFTWASSCCWLEVWGCYLLFSFLQQLVVTGYYRAPLEVGVTFQCCFHSSIARHGLGAGAVSTLL